jgi:hypothetical protein
MKKEERRKKKDEGRRTKDVRRRTKDVRRKNDVGRTSFFVLPSSRILSSFILSFRGPRGI